MTVFGAGNCLGLSKACTFAIQNGIALQRSQHLLVVTRTRLGTSAMLVVTGALLVVTRSGPSRSAFHERNRELSHG